MAGSYTRYPNANADTDVIIVPQSGSTGALSSIASSGLVASLIIKASPGRLFNLIITNTKASAQYIQLFNSTTLPADTTAALVSIYVPATSSASIDYSLIGRYFSTGIVVSNSSTAATKTIGSADCFFSAEYL